MMKPNTPLLEILEAGRAWIATYEEAHVIYLDVTVEEITDGNTIPFAIFRPDQQSLNAAKLLVATILELCPSGELKIPDVFAGEVQGASEIEAELLAGNTGTASDNKAVEILDSHGRVLREVDA